MKFTYLLLVPITKRLWEERERHRTEEAITLKRAERTNTEVKKEIDR